MMHINEHAAVDWIRQKSAGSRIGVLAKKILRKYSYPNLWVSAVQPVLQRAVALSAE